MTEPGAFSAYVDAGDTIQVPDGTCLFQPGDDSQNFLVVTSGTVRVEQTNAEGRTVVLYRVGAGQSCVLTTTGLLTARPYSGYGYAEGDVAATVLGANRFRALFAEDARFRDLVLQAVVERVGELTDVIDALLLHRTDTRLAAWLAGHGAANLHLTQQDIAAEIGTAREVVSRTLKSFEREGWVQLGRGAVTVLDPEALSRYAAV